MPKTRRPQNEKGEQCCTTCDEWKHLEEFNRDRNKLNGRKASCRVCTTAQHAAARKARVASPEGVPRRCTLCGDTDPKNFYPYETSRCIECGRKNRLALYYATMANPETAEGERLRNRARDGYRRRKRRQAQPRWLTKEHRRQIRAVYKKRDAMNGKNAKTAWTPFVVDHIIPIGGEHVCGLHVPWNLRVITREENLAKSNKLHHSQ